jgi:hypothetical protein
MGSAGQTPMQTTKHYIDLAEVAPVTRRPRSSGLLGPVDEAERGRRFW